MTEFEIASAIMNYVTSNQGVTDSNISIEQIRDEVDTLRLRMLREMEAGTTFEKDSFTQSLILPTATVENGRFKGRKYAKIPRIYTLVSNKPAVFYINGEGNTKPFRLVWGNQHHFFTYDSYIGNKPTAYVEKDMIYVLNSAPAKIELEAIFNKPSELGQWDQYDYKNDQYPAPMSLVDTIIGKTAESYIRTMYRIFPQPNTQADIPIQPKK